MGIFDGVVLWTSLVLFCTGNFVYPFVHVFFVSSPVQSMKLLEMLSPAHFISLPPPRNPSLQTQLRTPNRGWSLDPLPLVLRGLPALPTAAGALPSPYLRETAGRGPPPRHLDVERSIRWRPLVRGFQPGRRFPGKAHIFFNLLGSIALVPKSNLSLFIIPSIRFASTLELPFWHRTR